MSGIVEKEMQQSRSIHCSRLSRGEEVGTTHETDRSLFAGYGVPRMIRLVSFRDYRNF